MSPTFIDQSSPFGRINFVVANADITFDSFELRAAVNVDSICNAIDSSVITITGDCGLGTTATITSESGLIVNLSGDAACA